MEQIARHLIHIDSLGLRESVSFTRNSNHIIRDESQNKVAQLLNRWKCLSVANHFDISSLHSMAILWRWFFYGPLFVVNWQHKRFLCLFWMLIMLKKIYSHTDSSSVIAFRTDLLKTTWIECMKDTKQITCTSFIMSGISNGNLVNKT